MKPAVALPVTDERYWRQSSEPARLIDSAIGRLRRWESDCSCLFELPAFREALAHELDRLFARVAG